jgi:hypothetical protein
MKILIYVAGLIIVVSEAAATSRAEHWLNLENDAVTVGVNTDLTIATYLGGEAPDWESHATSTPSIDVQYVGDKSELEPQRLRLGDAEDREVREFSNEAGSHTGHRIRLRRFPNTDVEVELILALATEPGQHGAELMVQVEQVAGRDRVHRVAGLYDWKLASAADAFTIAPWSSGYILRTDAEEAFKLTGFVGGAYSLPVFSMFRGDRTCYQIVDTWWDARFTYLHAPADGTTLSLDWEPSLGELNYPRRVFYRFARDLDHVGVAKGYRQYLVDRGEFVTLGDRGEKSPALKKFLSGAEYRWTHWDLDRPHEKELVLANVRRFQEAGVPISFFFPKWPSEGYSSLINNSASWQAVLLDDPAPGGWPGQVELLNQVRKLGCSVKIMINPHNYHASGPGFEEAKSRGKEGPHWNMSQRHAVWAMETYLDKLAEREIHPDAIYLDGYAAHVNYDEHRDAEGPLTRREFYESQVDCYEAIHRRGIAPGAELARFWSIPGCDYFFFTDWSQDRLREGDPIPFFQLVFHDCYAAHFSGGGYYNEGKYDWYADRHPRLYELMYCAIPSHNWLPGGSRPIEESDWGTDKMDRRLRWMKRWHSWFQRVCYSEMTSHQFLNDAGTLQRVEFANGVAGDFDLAEGRFRIEGVAGFSGDWEEPELVER